MRGKFNTTADFYKGPGSGSPGTFVGTFPCKLVREDAISTDGLGAPVISWYLTIDAYLPIGSWTFPTFGLDPALADRIAVPSGLSPQFWVLYTDVVRWHALTPYYRSYLVLLPAPPPSGSGGVEVDGAAVWSFVLRPASAGGVEINGSAYRTVAKHFVGHGGVEVNSAAIVKTRYSFVGKGGVEVNSSALVELVYSFVGKGGVEVNSSALVELVYSFVGKGGVEVDGSATKTTVPPQPSSTAFDVVGVGGVGGVIRFDGSTTGFATGDHVTVSGATVMTNVNGAWTITVLNGFQCTFDGSIANAVSDGAPVSTIVMQRVI